MPIEYRVASGGRVVVLADVPEELPEGLVWLDAKNPSDAELARLDEIMGFEIPNRQDISEIELSSRLYKETGALVMIASLLPKSEGRSLPPRPAAFVIRRDLLLTVRYDQFYSFERVAAELTRGGDTHTPVEIFSRLLEEAVADRADNLEFSMRHLEELTTRLFDSAPSEAPESTQEGVKLDAALRRIGKMGENVSNIRESITSLQRVVNFAVTYMSEDWLGDQKIVLASLKTDLAALSDEAGFFMNKLSFNLDATLGMINIDETKIIRLLSIVTLLLSPPTLIAGIYGMNFRNMPELEWPLGYALSLGLMLATAIVSIWYLRRKRWM